MGVLTIVVAGVFMLLVDVSIVDVAIPSIRRSLDASTGQIQLVSAGYQLAFACVLITAGRLGDIYGRRLLFLIGLAGFTLASVAAGGAPGARALVISRVVQGFFGGLLFPQVLSLIRTSFSRERRGRAFSVFGAAIGVATATGPLLGGFLIFIDLFGLGWRAVFLVNVPCGVLVLVAAWRWLPTSYSVDRPSLDVPGTVLITLGLFLLIYPVTEGRAQGWPVYMLVLLGLSVAVLAGFGMLEHTRTRQRNSPLVPMTLFSDRAFCVGLVLVFTFVMGVPAFFFTLSLFLQVGFDYSALQSGWIQFAFAVGSGVASWYSDWFARRLSDWVLSLGSAGIALGMLGLLLATHAMGERPDPWVLSPLLLLGGTGLGLFIAPVTNIVLQRVRSANAGAAAGVFATAQRLGGSVGVAAIGILFFGVLQNSAGGHAGRQAYSVAFQHALVYESVLFALTFLAVFLLPRKRPEE